MYRIELHQKTLTSSIMIEINRDRGATLRLGVGVGAPLVTQYWGGGGIDQAE